MMSVKRRRQLACVYLAAVPKQALLSYRTEGAVIDTVAAVVNRGFKKEEVTLAIDSFQTGKSCSADDLKLKIAYEVLLHEFRQRGFNKLSGRLAHFSRYAKVDLSKAISFFEVAAMDLIKRAQKPTRPPKK
jgi:hypothetical protein